MAASLWCGYDHAIGVITKPKYSSRAFRQRRHPPPSGARAPAIQETATTMKRSTDRTLTTHCGRLPDPEAQMELRQARAEQNQSRVDDLTQAGIQEMIRCQRMVGLDILTDGEFWKARNQQWFDDRCTGVILRPSQDGEPVMGIYKGQTTEGRMPEFEQFFTIFDQVGNTPGVGQLRRRGPELLPVIVAPIQVTSGQAVRREVERTKVAVLAAGERVEDFTFPVLGPGWLGHLIKDEYYHERDRFNYALAELFKNDYHAVIDAGFNLQIDDPALCNRNTRYVPPMNREAYRKDCQARIEATNWALKGLPQERIIYHTCWGSYHTPHTTDMPFEWVIDLLPTINAGAYSVEAADVRHELDWQLWETHKLPEGKTYLPGVIAHKTSTVEPPELVAFRIERYAKLMGRENVIASLDCGLGGRAYPEVAWAKLKALTAGARLATQHLWG
jgi:5-methyltetrahydropteroyltriglutamate--homocysteine methyltransferase